jgi:Tol biopolymer transport system component
MIGTRLGPYEITAKLGEGGMGEVYRAIDTRLDRKVAVKILSTRLADEPDLRVRFEREARAISALSHPHICTLFDIGHDAGRDYLVMELLAGETLAERLAKGSLPLEQSLRIGGQVAAALDHAHRQGFVHRDLKPGNIMLTGTGAKLLDFGLAKLLVAPSNERSPSSVAELPTELASRPPLTGDGTVVGTLQYMAPEQLEGRAVDAGADVWSLGCVLYEMVTGRRAFAGSSSAALIATILGGEPEPVTALAPTTPGALARLIHNCLVKNAEHRWQSARDVALELAGIAGGGDAPGDGAARRPGTVGKSIALAATVLVATLSAFWLGQRGERAAPPGEIRFQVSPPPGAVFSTDQANIAFAISPEGTTLAFVAAEGANTRLWRRRLDTLEASPLHGTEGARSLAWSPDGGSIAFFAGDKLKRLDLASGSTIDICSVPAWLGFGASWGATDQILFASGTGQAIYRVAAAGGAVETLMQPEEARREVRVSWPRYFPDGRGFLYLSRDVDYVSTLMQVEAGQPPRPVAPLASRFELTGADLLVFARDGALLGQRLDRAAGRLVGAPSSIAPTVRYHLPTASASFAASPARTIVYLSERTSSHLALVDRGGRTESSIGAAGDYLRLTLSPDGRSILTDRTRPRDESSELWLIDIERGGETKVASDPRAIAEFAGLWLADGKGIVYSALASSGWSPNLYRRNLGSERGEPLLPHNAFQRATDVTRDDRRLAFIERSPSGNFRAWTLWLDGDRRAEQIFHTQADESEVRFSIDGTHVAYLSDESGSRGAYLSSLANPEQKTRLFPGTAKLLRWRRDGREILLLTPEGQMLAVPVGSSPGLQLGRPTVLFTLAQGTFWRDFDVSADGRRFLAIVRERAGEAQPASVILKWTTVSAR